MPTDLSSPRRSMPPWSIRSARPPFCAQLDASPTSAVGLSPPSYARRSVSAERSKRSSDSVPTASDFRSNSHHGAPSARFAIFNSSFSGRRSQLSTLAPSLRAYFYSGWAFLIPYLFFYLLYEWEKWPANPVAGAIERPPVVSSQLSLVHGPSSVVPCLLYVYWALHAIHFILAAIAFRSWWKTVKESAVRDKLPAKISDVSALSSQLSALSKAVSPALPWALLALVFYIPGVYLEWPSDPWEHYRRINAWHFFPTVTECSFWLKTNYFFQYSLIGTLSAGDQVRWLHVYSAIFNLLLSWQYYRLARATGLSERPALLFVVLLAVTFGNSSFSFFRYYDLASTLPAHLAAVAFVRIFTVWLTVALKPTVSRRFYHIPHTLLAASLLAALMAFNHFQSLVISLIGTMAACLWWLASRYRLRLWWIISFVLIVNAGAVWALPHLFKLASHLQYESWLTFWGGFDIFTIGGPAQNRAIEMIGGFGLINLTAGVYLWRRNHLVGWLTIAPVIFLMSPCFALPFMTWAAKGAADASPMFSRTLLAIPTGLAVVTLFSDQSAFRGRVLRTIPFFSLYLIALLLLMIAPPIRPFFNRFWHSTVQIPADLSLRPIIALMPKSGREKMSGPYDRNFLAPPGIGFAAAAIGVPGIIFDERLISYPLLLPPSGAGNRAFSFLCKSQTESVRLIIIAPLSLYTPASQAGIVCGHWLPQEVALRYACSAEIETWAVHQHATPQHLSRDITIYRFGSSPSDDGLQTH